MNENVLLTLVNFSTLKGYRLKKKETVHFTKCNSAADGGSAPLHINIQLATAQL